MKKTDKDRGIAMSDLYFHQKVVNKYRLNKTNPFGFPVMLFYKNRGHVLSQKNNMNILLQLHLHKQDMMSITVKGIQEIKRLFSCFMTEKLIPQSVLLSAVHFSAKKKSIFFFIQSMLSRTGNINTMLQPSFSATDAFFYLQRACNISSYSERLFNFGKNVQVINPQAQVTSFQRLSKTPSIKRTYHSGFEYKIPAMFSQVNLLLDNKARDNINKDLFNKTFQNWTTVNKPLIKHHHYSFGIGSDNINYISARQRTAFKMDGEDNFYFHKQRKMEEEFEELKKIVIETKEAVAEKPASTHSLSDMDIKQYFDINRISDQVYHNIERRIRIERERRGL
ncbi:MAG: hypothetical protein GXO97_08105 [Nitrospirae bacterium]|nr:hypothetical protein [Nitrospirota bacterium]